VTTVSDPGSARTGSLPEKDGGRATARPPDCGFTIEERSGALLFCESREAGADKAEVPGPLVPADLYCSRPLMESIFVDGNIHKNESTQEISV
jgi:hypothetical protein